MSYTDRAPDSGALDGSPPLVELNPPPVHDPGPCRERVPQSRAAVQPHVPRLVRATFVGALQRFLWKNSLERPPLQKVIAHGSQLVFPRYREHERDERSIQQRASELAYEVAVVH